jgi:hypothetical protein
MTDGGDIDRPLIVAKDEGPLVWHYTTVDGLYGILTDKRIHATDIRFLNDYAELVYALPAINAGLTSLAMRLEDRPDLQELVIEASRYVDSYFAEAGGVLPNIYVACFCEEADLLSQWRAYANGGYAIGFRRNTLQEKYAAGVVGNLNTHPSFNTITYIKEAHRRIVDETIASRLDDYFRARAIYLPDSDRSVAFDSLDLAWDMLRLMSTVKSDAFLEEAEWRVISHVSDPMLHGYGFKPRGDRLVPYVQMEFEPEDIAHIVIGPGSDFELKKDSLRSLLYWRGFDPADVQITPSRATYRAT